MTQDNSPSLKERLASGELLISDGATGTYLQDHGLEPGGCPEEFNAAHPETVLGMARDYFAVGSEMVLTNSFGANRFMLKKYGFGGRVEEFNKLAAQHASSQRTAGQYVIGSVGPTGEFLEPLGPVTREEMLDAFVEQVTALEAGGADGVVIETMSAVEEAVLAVEAAKEHTGLVVMATMVFDRGPRGFFTMMGVTPERAVKELAAVGADVTGANCGNGIDVMVELAREMRQATDGPLLVHSNAGIPAYQGGEIVYPESPDYMVERFGILADMGIDILGGCCGTGPEHIRALVSAMKPGSRSA